MTTPNAATPPRRRRTRAAAWALALPTALGALIVTGAPAVGDAPETLEVRAAAARATLPAWWPLLALGRGDRDPSTEPVAAADKVDRMLAAAGTVVFGFSPQGRAKALIEDVIARLEDFDVEEAYEVLPDRGPRTPWRAVAVEGRVQDDDYVLRVFPSGIRRGTTERSAEELPALPAVGDVMNATARFRLRPVDASAREEFEDDFLAVGEASVSLGELRWEQVLAVADEWLHLVEAGVPPTPEEIRGAGLGRSIATRPVAGEAGRARVTADHPRLDAEDQAFLALLAEAYPAFYELGKRHTALDDLVELVALPDGRFAARLRIVARMLPDELEALYPDLAEYLRDLEDLLTIEARIVDPDGRRVASLRLDTRTLRMTIEMVTRDGALLPTVDRPRAPVASTVGYRLDELDDAAYEVRVSLWTNTSGIRGEIRDIVVSGRYDRTDRGAALATRVTGKPKVTFRGAAFGVIPTWMVDVLIPSDMTTLTDDFFRVLVDGRDGDGATTAVAIERRHGPGGTEPLVLEGRADLEILNNALINFAIKIANRRILPHDETRDQVLEFLREGFEALREDTQRFADRAREVAASLDAPK